MADPTQPEKPAVPCLLLYGICGDDIWGDGFTAKGVADWLNANADAKEIEVRLNSPGGFVDEGLACYNLLSGFSAQKTMRVDGVAASMASIIMLAGDERIIGNGALVMWHNPHGVSFGESKDHRKSADLLDKMRAQMIRIYSSRTGMSETDIGPRLDAETWLEASECLEMGVATKIDGATDDKALASVRLDHLGLSHALPARLLAARERHPELVPAARAAGAIRPRTLAPGEMLAEADHPVTKRALAGSPAGTTHEAAPAAPKTTAAEQVEALSKSFEQAVVLAEELGLAATSVREAQARHDESAAAPGTDSEAAAPAVAEVNAENPMTTAEASAAKNAETLAAQAAARTSEMEGLKAQLAALQGEAEQTKKDNAALKAERDEDRRQVEIRRMGVQAKLGELAETMAIDKGVTVAMAKDKLFDALAKKQEDEQGKQAGSHVRVEGGADAAEKFAKGAEAWLIRRSEARVAKAVAAHAAASGKPADLDPGEFRGMTLMDIARASLEASGQRVSGFDKRRIVSQAFTMRPQGAIVQGTGDFPTLLENVMHKVMQAAYGTTPDTWREFCNVGTLTDFRPHNRYRTGSFGVLDLVLENGEYKQKAIPDGEKATISGLTKGNIYALSRQAIINDDMNALTGVAASAGRAAKLSIEVDIYALLALNAGLGPTMPDGLTLFHASHNNLGTTGAPSVTTFDEVNQLIGKQRDVTGNEVLDLRPSIWVGPRSYGMTARIVNEAQFDPSVSNKFQLPNGVRGIFSRIVDTSRLTSTRWYAFSDPASAPTLEVAFLDGVQEPFLDNETGWNVDGVEWKVRLDYGYAAIDYRGAVTNG